MIKTLLLTLTGLLCLNALHAGVQLNELMAINTRTKINSDNRQYGDWLELYNAGSSTVDLGNYFLTDDKEVPFKWRFPSGTSLSPNTYLLVWMDGTDTTATTIHASFSLSGMGEWLALTDLSGRIVDSVSFGRQVADHSYARSGMYSRWYYMEKSTPGAANDDATAYLMAPAPVLSRESEINPGTFSITVTPTLPGAQIRYTTNGAMPDESSNLYSGPVTISKTTIFRAIQVLDGYTAFWPASASFLFNVTTELPVISLVSDPVNLWDNYKGIYVTGLNGITGYCSTIARNYNQDWERPVTLDYFDREHLLGLHQDAGMKIFGGCSRSQSLKSLNIKADKSYGVNSFDYPFFREKPGMDKIKKFILRNSGNDFGSTMMRDAMMQALVKDDMGVDAQAYEPTVIYLNGAYWGIMNMREKIDENYIEANYSIPAESINLLENNRSVIAGSATTYYQLYTYISENDLSVAANYDYVCGKMDVQNYIRYTWAQIYIANTDWPGNNIRYWNTRDGSRKWNWLLYDTDFGFNLFNSPPNHNTLEFALYESGSSWPNPAWSTLILRKLMENENFASDFLAEAQTRMLSTFSQEHVIEVIDSIYNGIADEMPSHIARWSTPGSYSNWTYNVNYLKEWAQLRPSFMIEYLGDYFGISSSYSLNINYNSNEGVVWFNDVLLPGPVSNGSMLSGTQARVRVQAKPGYTFREWVVDTRKLDIFKLIDAGDNWRYFDQGTRPEGWEQLGFSDNSWPEGPSELGYGDGDEATVTGYGDDAGNKYITTYFRRSFTVDDPSALDSLVLLWVRDDGIVIYLNGTELLRDNMPDGVIDNTTLASTGMGGGDEATWHILELDPALLIAGTNTIAAEVHQSGATSSDISFNLKLTAWIDYGSSSTVYTDRELDLSVTDHLDIQAVFDKTAVLPDLKINELMAGNDSFITDEFGEYDDWIEILSRESAELDMGGMFLSDNKDNLPGFMIPYGDERTVIQPGEYKVFWADGEDLQGPLHLGFKLSAGGESVILSMYHDGELVIIDSISFPSVKDDMSMGLFQDLWGLCEAPTPGEENTGLIEGLEENLISSVLLYPNPAATELFVQLEEPFGTGPVRISIHDLQGRTVLYFEQDGINASGLRLDLTGLQDGLYLLMLSEQGRTSTHKLLICK